MTRSAIGSQCRGGSLVAMFGAPGPRPAYGHDYYGGFLIDADGHNVEVVNHNS